MSTKKLLESIANLSIDLINSNIPDSDSSPCINKLKVIYEQLKEIKKDIFLTDDDDDQSAIIDSNISTKAIMTTTQSDDNLDLINAEIKHSEAIKSLNNGKLNDSKEQQRTIYDSDDDIELLQVRS